MERGETRPKIAHGKLVPAYEIQERLNSFTLKSGWISLLINSLDSGSIMIPGNFIAFDKTAGKVPW